MINLTQTFTLLTPCFCAGADQNQAEIRSASIRGQLRWWFRILGGTPEMENNVFGGVHNDTKASRIILRLTDSKPIYGQPGMLPQRNNTPGYYLFHFAKVSNGGIRYQKKAFLAPGSTFTVQCLERKTMDREEQRLLEKSWRAFSLLGALGLRATRACGAFQTEGLTWQDLPEILQEFRHCLKFWYVSQAQNRPDFARDWRECISKLEGALGHLRQNGYSAGPRGDNPTPLGNARPRQSSALHLRPLALQEGLLPLLFFTPQTLASGENLDLSGIHFNPKYSQNNKTDQSNRTHNLDKLPEH